jgi:hypothetical protein
MVRNGWAAQVRQLKEIIAEQARMIAAAEKTNDQLVIDLIYERGNTFILENRLQAASERAGAAESGRTKGENNMEIKEYQDITRRAVNNVAHLFKPKELMVLMDFIQTVTQKDIDEVADDGKPNKVD